MKVRTITVFASLSKSSLADGGKILKEKIKKVSELLQAVKISILGLGWEVQTVRVAFNDPQEYLFLNDAIALDQQLDLLDAELASQGIEFCSLGRLTTTNIELLKLLPSIILKSPRFNVSVDMPPTDFPLAKAAADVAIAISKPTSGSANFRFCVSACCEPGLPYFPGALAGEEPEGEDRFSFALGLENGDAAQAIMSKAGTIANIHQAAKEILMPSLEKLEACCKAAAQAHNASYIGIDTSLNPSLDPGYSGSVAQSFEKLEEINEFGCHGTLAAVAATTHALQALTIMKTGYCGLMLPVCEDRRLAELTMNGTLSLTTLLTLSSVCGVGIDTVPVPGDVSVTRLAALYLDVAALANRWKKPLSCRVFPVPGARRSDVTEFNSPYLVNASVLPIP